MSIQYIMNAKIYKDLMSTAILIALLTYFLIPLAFKYYIPLSRRLIFLNTIHWPPFVNFNFPDKLGLLGTQNYNINVGQNITIGLWHTLPEDMLPLYKKDTHSYNYLNSGHPIILYLHGNAGTRAGWHRIMLYKILSKMNFHIISFDYRGFGDSIGTPTEKGVLDDAKYVYSWIKHHSGNNPIILWGHSLGSGVTTKLARFLNDNEAYKPAAVILEAPFTNIEEAASRHPFSRIYRYFPWFTGCFLEPLRRNKIYFKSDINVKYIDSPLLIMHAKDDNVVPYELGYKLHQIAKESKKDSNIPVIFSSFEAKLKLGHKHIHSAPDLPDIIRKFMDTHVLNKIKGY
ncbi:unnamed protein product [Gordionus sp. m RMFG-2023]|uniref:lysophosphatidylserine lipase ABHD12-like n=1 Tax=Gordionus sp. m RMFG-2023 TaxID=3053472 RepID=UPI0030DE73B7